MWVASYWIGFAGMIALLVYFGVHPVVPVLLAIAAAPIFIILANRRNTKNE
jgi:hypothetical protein